MPVRISDVALKRNGGRVVTDVTARLGGIRNNRGRCIQAACARYGGVRSSYP